MVLEAIINPLKAEKHPAMMILYGFGFCSVALLLSWWIFKDHASLVMVFLTTIVCIPLIYNTIRMEEEKDESILEEALILKEHFKALLFFSALFFGFVLAFALWFVVLPGGTTASLYSVQIDTFMRISGGITGNASQQITSFFSILVNNVKVLFFCILFAFVFGFGAIFILAWNASVIGAAIGTSIRAGLAKASLLTGFTAAGEYFTVISVGLTKYVLHGIPEIGAYFTAGLGASIISVAIARHSLDPEKFKRVMLDATDLILISFILVLVAAFIEVFITPIFFAF
ncbi:MAG: stage II sporulation protein M [archaeon]